MPSPPAPAESSFRSNISRARWSVIQTGLITSGLALFGVYVMASRTNDLHLVNYYKPEWFPSGALILGLIASSGYLLAAWWYGVNVSRWMLLAIVMLQIATYFAAQYTDFQSQDLIDRIKRQPVSFWDYFQFTTTHLYLGDEADPIVLPTAQGYARRGLEVLVVALGGIMPAMVLMGQPSCTQCHGRLRRRRIGLATKESLRPLEALISADNHKAFRRELESHESENPKIPLILIRCEVCGRAEMHFEEDGPPIPITPEFAAKIWSATPRP